MQELRLQITCDRINRYRRETGLFLVRFPEKMRVFFQSDEKMTKKEEKRGR